MNFARILAHPRKSFFLLGPRGTGKSTWLRAVFPDAHMVNLLDEETHQRYLVAPKRFRDEIRPLPSGRWVVIDEVQRLPNLLNEVHRAIEEQGLRFVLSGSSARKLKRSGVNLLAGRALHRAMHPFVPEELGAQFDLDTAMTVGLLPVVWDDEDRVETLAAYARMYLKEEIQAEALVRNLPGFARFLPIAALCHAQTINAANIARESGVSRTTVAGYLDILEETLLCFRLSGYEAQLRVRERKHPKWYWCDAGLVRAMKGARFAPVAEERGALFEGLVAQLLRAYRDYRNAFDEWYYWSSQNRSTEVDFLICRGRETLAIEVKSGTRFDPAWCKGLRAIQKLDGLCRRILVYPEGPALRTDDGIDVLPFTVFAQQLSQNELWP